MSVLNDLPGPIESGASEYFHGKGFGVSAHVLRSPAAVDDVILRAGSAFSVSRLAIDESI
jgi:hypothetical protein